MVRRSRTLFALAGVIVLFSVLTAPTKSGKIPAPLLSGAKIDAGALAIIQRSCQDCHSDRTRYPWYSYVFPVSWLVGSDVRGGRRHLDLSRWNESSLTRRERSLSEIANQVKDRDMPLPQYLWIHGNAKLSDEDVRAIFQWTQAERARLIAENGQATGPQP
ncbi:MAG: heme-binding domain-containing protein [Acidobacteriia bacterium]|nr:heme-binding domain-containing protein [Terriglobia bacterium]